MKKVSLPPGTYIIAVSGGVDSMVLLDVARSLPGVKLVVAHIDHGIRDDSHLDRELVERIAMSHNLAFTATRLELGWDASEEVARTARYNFLRHTKERYAADAILTAHHANDVIETAVINLVRGTGWRGLSSLRSVHGIIRPFLGVSKAEIVAYARRPKLVWREDSTNNDSRYLRNKLRKHLAHVPSNVLEQLHKIIVRQNIYAEQIDAATENWLSEFALEEKHATTLPRYQLIMMPDNVAHELLQSVLRRKSGKSLQRPLVDRALLFCKVAKAGKTMPLGLNLQLRALPREVIVEPRENVVS